MQHTAVCCSLPAVLQIIQPWQDACLNLYVSIGACTSESHNNSIITAAQVEPYLDVNFGYSSFRIICNSPYLEPFSEDTTGGPFLVSFAEGPHVFAPRIPVTQVGHQPCKAGHVRARC